MVVLAEFLIVIARFIFSYEQTFMGDLVRFWYAALFLLASAQTLVEEGHVRVDVLYAGLTDKTKAKINMMGSLLLGIPLCWVIMWRGLSGKTSLINSPMLNFETSMSGYGMYVKYLMAAFLLMFALTMLIQFSSYVLSSMDRIGRSDDHMPDGKMENA
jgi:TRAP-type mannitol/chloroaromatic compound transport system permease small subunit